MQRETTTSSHPEVFLVKDLLKIRSKFPGEHPCRSVISIKLLCKFIEITLRNGCSLVNLLHIFRIPFPKNTSGRLLLVIQSENKSLAAIVLIIKKSNRLSHFKNLSLKNEVQIILNTRKAL